MLQAATLSDPQVDAYNVRVGTETFAGLYKFTTNTLLVETAEAITNLGSDTIKFYLGYDTSFQRGVTLTPNITNLLTLARDEPSYRKVFDMPFRHYIIWAYPFANSDDWWGSGYNATQGAKDYGEMYDLTRYLLTNYNNSGKTFYLGHWEGDGYLKVNDWTTNPSPATIQGMIGWLNNRQQAVDDAKRDTVFTNVNVFNYTEANRVRDAMLDGPTNNQRVINYVVPYVTNLDYLSYSSYDAEDLSASDLHATLYYMQSMLPANKAGSVPGERIWIGEYGHGGWSTDSQEPFNRGYIQRLLNWNYNGQVVPFILYWEMYDNEAGKNFCLIDSNNVKTASWYLQNYFINDARLRVAQFKETHGRLPTDTEFVSLVSPLLDQPLPAPVPLSLTDLGTTMLTNTSVTVSGSLAQGVYGDDQARVWVFYGRKDGGTTPGAWENSRFIGVNTNFNPTTFVATLTNLVSQTNYFFRFYATNASSSAWAPSSAQFGTQTLNPSDFGSRLKVSFAGYHRAEILTNFPALVILSTNLPGFSYRQFASPSGGDLRFTDGGGWRLIPHEIDEWDTNGTSAVWVNVPLLSSSTDCIWAYWGNPAAANPPFYTTNGAAWPGFDLVWHLKENGFPFADGTLQHPATNGVTPVLNGGVIGHGESFDGFTEYLDAGTVNLGTAFTLSAWVNVALNAGNIQSVWANGAGGYNSAGFRLFVNSYNTSDGKVLLETGNGSQGAAAATGTGAVSFGQWHLLTAAVDEAAGAARLFVDGADETQSGPALTDFANQSDVNLGRFTNSVYYFKGALDEARIQSGVQSSNWIWASWATVAANAALETYSAVAREIPALTIGAVGGSGTLLTWPGSGVGFALYSASNLTAPVVWTQATNSPVLADGRWQVDLAANNHGACFYRLKSQ
ncbi:MAG: DUF2341 domain-containing protein [Verrucomicrobiota bacterium]|nr:DUF2341 domain-containing protein [Verrucomicrobiota bacterium]